MPFRLWMFHYPLVWITFWLVVIIRQLIYHQTVQLFVVCTCWMTQTGFIPAFQGCSKYWGGNEKWAPWISFSLNTPLTHITMMTWVTWKKLVCCTSAVTNCVYWVRWCYGVIDQCLGCMVNLGTSSALDSGPSSETVGALLHWISFLHYCQSWNEMASFLHFTIFLGDITVLMSKIAVLISSPF